jgi:transposase
MQYITGENREQITLMAMCLDDYIGTDSVVRVIDAFVDTLDLVALDFKKAEIKECGRPPYSPAMMLKLYIYGYMNRVRSSRRLQTEARRNVEVMWLTEKIEPDDRAIAYFRHDNAAALKKVFKEFSVWCKDNGLYGGKSAAIDGTKMRANANRNSIHTSKLTNIKLTEIDEKIDKYMKILDKTDSEELNESTISPETVQSILKNLSEKKDKLLAIKRQIDENDGKEISTVDCDAHIMHTNGDGRSLDACYNVQAVADTKNKLIVDFDVTTCPDDKGALPKMAASAKEIMNVETLEVSADKGYYDGGDVSECENNGVTTFIPQAAEPTKPIDPDYSLNDFRYDSATDTYKCPNGKVLYFHREKKRYESEVRDRVYLNKEACKNCLNCDKCFKNITGYRQIFRSSNQDALDRNNERMKTSEGKDKYRTRSCTIEHPFGTIKAVWGFKQYLCRGQLMTTAEQSLAFLAYNLKRVVNIFAQNGENLVEAMQ